MYIYIYIWSGPPMNYLSFFLHKMTAYIYIYIYRRLAGRSANFVSGNRGKNKKSNGAACRKALGYVRLQDFGDHP